VKPSLDNKGKKDWKSVAVTGWERIGIRLPSQRTLAHNAAEACALAICWEVKEMKVHAGRYQEALMALRMQRNERPAA
jgi:1,2-phenylacetyl-CoA epoxidase catalytic subunit